MSAIAEKSIDINKRRKFIGLGIALGGLALLGGATGALGLFGRSNKGRLFTFRSRRSNPVIDQDSIFYPRDEAVRRNISGSGDLDRT